LEKDKLQRQLTNEVMSSEKIEDVRETPEVPLVDYEDSLTEHDSDNIQNKAYLREMQELQQALASEVDIHTSKKRNNSVKRESNPESTSQITSYFNSENKLNEQIKLKKTEEKGKLPLWAGAIIAAAIIGLTVCIVLFANRISRTALLKLGFIKEEQAAMVDNVITPMLEIPVLEPTSIPEVTDKPTVEPEENVEEDEVHYVLLIGIDSVESKGSADAIMVAGVNVTDQTYQLIQFMRDLYVDIPGYGKTRLAEAFRYGGGRLLAETISTNFELPIEGYISADFDGFVKIVDMIGGVQVNLTKDEAEYLNHTNYIEDKSLRTMKAGKQKMNGKQTMGYLRISQVPDASRSSNDFGRSSRAKQVMTYMADRMKRMSFGDLIMTMNEVLVHIRTSLTQDRFRDLITIITDLGIDKPQTLRIPIYKQYTKKKLHNQTVIVPNLDVTKKEIRLLVFGEEKNE